MQESEFDKFAEEYHNTLAKIIRLSGEDPSYFYRYKVELTASISRARQLRVERILDFGSGVGNSVPFFLERFPEAKLSCADISRRSLEVSEKRFSDCVEHSEIKGKELPFANGQFDLAFSACVFHHIDHAEPAFRESSRPFLAPQVPERQSGPPVGPRRWLRHVRERLFFNKNNSPSL